MPKPTLVPDLLHQVSGSLGLPCLRSALALRLLRKLKVASATAVPPENVLTDVERRVLGHILCGREKGGGDSRDREMVHRIQLRLIMMLPAINDVDSA